MSYVIYAKENCSYCIRAIGALQNAKETYEYKVLNKDFTREELLERFPEAKTFPQIETADGTYIGGYTELKEHLG